MILEAMLQIKNDLQQYIVDAEQSGGTEDIVILDNIARSEDTSSSNGIPDKRIIMSLVNLQEEATLKNEPYNQLDNSRTVYRNPPVHLNLFILFSALYREQYDLALKSLSRVIEFFQWRKELSFTTVSSTDNPPRTVQIVPDLYSLTFEQLNYLWGSLGGKQVPFALYRFRIVPLEAEKRAAEGVPITAISIHTNGSM